MSAPLAALALFALAAAPDVPAAAAEAPLEVSAPALQGSALAAGAAVFPGLLVHGSGHYVLGEPQAARNLLLVQGVGLTSFLAGFALLAATGAADPLAPVYVVPTLAGLGAISLSWAGDLAGALRGGAGWPTAWQPGPGLFVAAGYDGLFGSQLDLGHGLATRLTLRGEDLWLSPWGQWHPRGTGYGAAGALAGWRLLQPDPGSVTRLDVVLDARHQRFSGDRFHVSTGELYLEGRADLGFVSRTLRNTWALGRLGWGFEGYGYDAGEALWEDGRPLLVLDLGMGLQLSERVGVELAWRQRKNELPGAVMASSGLTGFLGMLQLDARIRVADGWAVLPTVRLGVGVRASLALEARL